jgi:3-methyladenine DNA glycosylase AlkC
MDGFRYNPLAQFIGEHGLDHFELAMQAQYDLTQRFTAEFSIRPFIQQHADATLARLRDWTADPSEHVRRLVSEGTRPRLPWAPRLRAFMDDPSPVVELLELLRNDPSEYVRRSVANNINDIAKDHPDVAIDIARRWWPDTGCPEQDVRRRRLVRHGLRTLLKAGDRNALDVLGYAAGSPVLVRAATVDPPRPMIGESVRCSVELHNGEAEAHRVLVDFRVWFVKANGSASPKVFKGTEAEIEAGATVTVSKKLSLQQHSTRTHHPGDHVVEVLVNGEARPVGTFVLR